MMTPRSRKPVLLISGTNITKLPSVEISQDPPPKKLKNETNDSLSSPFQDYLCSRSIITTSPTDNTFSTCTDDYDSNDFNNISNAKLSNSLLYCLDGNVPEENDEQQEKELILKPKQYDENGKPVVFETSF